MKKLWKSFDISIIAFAAAAVCIVFTFFLDVKLAAVELAAAITLFVIKLIYQKKKK